MLVNQVIKRSANFFVIVLIFLVIQNHWNVPRISADQFRQMVAVKNIIDGNGVTFQLVGQSTEIYKNKSFPLGYYAIMVPVSVLNEDIVLNHRLMEALGIILTILVLYKLSRWLGRSFNLPMEGLEIMLFSLIQLNPWRAMSFTDIWSLFFLLMSLYIVLKSEDLSAKSCVLVGLFAFFSVFLRYAYYPLAFIPVLVIALKWKRYRREFIITSSVLVLLLLSMNVFHYSYFSGFTTAPSRASSHWFLENLKQMEPVFFNSILSDHVLFSGIGKERWGVNTDWNLRYALVAFSFLLLLLMFIRTWRSSSQLNSQGQPRFTFVKASLMTLAINLGFIAAISVYYSSKHEEYIYTWLLISRYFAPSYVLIQALVVIWYFNEKVRAYKYAIGALVVFSICFQGAYMVRSAVKFSDTNVWYNYTLFYERPLMPDVMDKYSKMLSNPDYELEIIEDELSYQYLSMYYLADSHRTVQLLEQQCPECLEVFSK